MRPVPDPPLQSLDVLLEAGATVGPITIIGGGARSTWWGRVLAAALRRPLVYREGSELGPACGAARLARLGVSGAPLSTVCAPPPIRTAIEPEPRDIDRLAPKRERFGHLYEDLRQRFQKA
jgi:xylulokinase